MTLRAGGRTLWAIMNIDLDALKKRFVDLYGRPAPRLARAPGRGHLIGEHTDYNDGYVLPMAIERETVALTAPRDDLAVRLTSVQTESTVEINLGQHMLIQPGKPDWANYPKGVAAKIFAEGVTLKGADILFDTTVPLGGGLSSSASLEIATAKALLAASGNLYALDDKTIITCCQAAEHEFAGAPCGIMDQSISLLAQAGRALLLDCRTAEGEHVPFDNPDVVLLVVDTKVKHANAGGEYAQRREECYRAAEEIGVGMLRDADLAAVESAEADGRLGDPAAARARHVVGEIRRTLEACNALTRGDYGRFGELMYQSHASLRDDYEVSCKELDKVVELAGACEGVYGARMTGGGFGGCAIVLAQADRADAITDHIAKGFAAEFATQPGMFPTRAAAGASVSEIA